MLNVIDTAQYVGAAGLLTRANTTAAETALKLFDALEDAARSAGRTDGAAAWSDAYREAADPVVAQLSRLIDAFGTCARLLDASGHNHARAEAAAAPYGLPDYALPQRPLRSAALCGGVPSVYGGNADQPAGWGLIASHLGGYLWPGADLDRLHALATAWHAAAERLSAIAYYPTQAAAELELLRSAELPDAVGASHRLGKAALALADDCDALGDACTTFTHEVQHQRDHARDVFVELALSIGLCTVVGDGLSVATDGLSALLAKAIDSGVLAKYAPRIVAALAALDGTLAHLRPALAGATDSAWVTAMADAEPVFAEIDRSTSVLASEVDAATTTGRGVGEGWGAALADDEVIDSGWADRRTLADHFARHSTDVGARTEADYVQAAQRLRERAIEEGLPTKVTTQGNVRVFDPKSGLFGSYRPDGLARTIFRPEGDVAEYWAKQPGELL